jgi:hypothetical protein
MAPAVAGPAAQEVLAGPSSSGVLSAAAPDEQAPRSLVQLGWAKRFFKKMEPRRIINSLRRKEPPIPKVTVHGFEKPSGGDAGSSSQNP